MSGAVVLAVLGGVPLACVICLLWAGMRSLRAMRADQKSLYFEVLESPYRAYDGVGGYDGGDFG
jgi:hypothetical protein